MAGLNKTPGANRLHIGFFGKRNSGKSALINAFVNQEVSIVSSEIDANSERATVVCQIKNAFIINPINGKMKQINALQDTLELVREYNKWLIRKDIPLQNGKQNRD